MTPVPVAALLREADPERYFAHLLVPREVRADVAALFAFDAELARLRDHARQPAMGEVRLQWWAEALDGKRDAEARAHPLAVALFAAMARHALPAKAFADMIEARRFDLYDDAPLTRQDSEGHFGETTGATLRLAALVLAPDAETAEAAGHGGCALGIATALRRLPVLMRRGQCPLPLDLLSEYGLDRAGLLASGQGAEAAVAAFAAFGRHHFARFIESARDLPQKVRPVFAPVSLAARVLRVAADRPGAVLAAGVPAAPLRDRWAMLRAASGRWLDVR